MIISRDYDNSNQISRLSFGALVEIHWNNCLTHDAGEIERAVICGDKICCESGQIRQLADIRAVVSSGACYIKVVSIPQSKNDSASNSETCALLISGFLGAELSNEEKESVFSYIINLCECCSAEQYLEIRKMMRGSQAYKRALETGFAANPNNWRTYLTEVIEVNHYYANVFMNKVILK